MTWIRSWALGAVLVLVLLPVGTQVVFSQGIYRLATFYRIWRQRRFLGARHHTATRSDYRQVNALISLVDVRLSSVC